jgi:flavorubredoxin
VLESGFSLFRNSERQSVHAGKELAKEKNEISTIVITHLNPDIVDTLAKVLTVVKRPAAGGITLVMSNPAKQVRRL